jgi:outer membrane protein OmpA-like peptidoglycan-associated protein
MTPTIPPTARRVLLMFLVALPLVAALAACDHSVASSLFVVVASASRNEPAPVLAAQDIAILRQAAVSEGGGIADVVDTNTGQPVRVTLTPLRPDGQVDHGPDRNTRVSANESQIEQLVSRQAADGPFDLLNLLAEAVKVSSVPGTLIVVTSGLSTAGGFDLRQLGWSAQPATVADQLEREGLLPQLNGWKVIFSGLGDTAGAQPALPLPQQTELVDYVVAICQAAGAASCMTDGMTRPDPASRSTYPDPAVSVPAVKPITGPHDGTGKRIPADVFFRLNSAMLLPGADTYLAPLAEQAVTQDSRVSIVGFASPESGSPSYNQKLSLARAQVIQDRMVALGVAPGQIVRVVGEGTAGKTAAACYRNGHLDESVCAALRYVDILLTPASGSTS